MKEKELINRLIQNISENEQLSDIKKLEKSLQQGRQIIEKMETNKKEKLQKIDKEKEKKFNELLERCCPKNIKNKQNIF